MEPYRTCNWWTGGKSGLICLLGVGMMEAWFGTFSHQFGIMAASLSGYIPDHELSIPWSVLAIIWLGGGIFSWVRPEKSRQNRDSGDPLPENISVADPLFQSLPVGVVYQNAGGIITAVNPAAERLIGTSADRLINRRFSDLDREIIHPDGTPIPADSYPAATALSAGEHAQDVVMGIYHNEIEDYIWVLANVCVLFQDGADTPSQVVTTFQDITRQIRAEKQLRTSWDRFRITLENSPLVVATCDRDLRYTWIHNPHPDVAAESVIGKRDDELYSHSGARRLMELKQRVLDTGEGIRQEILFPLESGEYTYDITARPLTDESGNIVGVSTVALDITLRTQAQKALRESEVEYRDLFTNAPVGIFKTHSRGEVLQVNPTMAEMLGMESSEQVADQYTNIGKELYKDPERRRQLLTLLREEGRAENFELEGVKSDGTTLWLNLNARISEHFPDGSFHLEGFATDITARKEAEQHAREEEAMFSTLFHTIPDAVYFKDREHRLVRANPAKAESHGTSPEELIGKTDYDCFPGEIADQTTADDEQVVRTGEPVIEKEVYLDTGDDQGQWVSVTKLPRRNSAGEIIGTMGLSRDITAQKKAETRYRALFNSIRDAIVIIDTNRKIVDANRAASELFGYTIDKVIGNSTKQFFSDPDQFEAMERELQSHRLDQEFRKTAELQKKNGAIFTGEVDIIYQRNSSGDVQGYFAIIRDVTERELMEQELIESQKMEALGQIAGGISHDFNNVLTAIDGVRQMIELKWQDPALQEYADMIRSSVERGSSLTHRMLTFTRSSEPELQPLSVRPFLQEFREIANHTLPKNVHLQLDLPKESGAVLADRGQMQQVLFTLCLNAADAMPDGGDIRISLHKPSEKEIQQYQPDQSEDYLCVLVEDTGKGMTEEIQAQIFEPFFTTKGSTRGTGLGLAVTQKILELHGGWIDVTSTPGQGSTFIVGLPGFETAAIEEDGSAASIEPGEGECLLIIEDESTVRHNLAETLYEIGYVVEAAGNAMSGLEVLQTEDRHIDLVLTDIGLPDIAGTKVVMRLQAQNPSLPVIAMTGYVDVVLEEELLSAGASKVIRKPYDITRLSQTIRTILGAQKRATSSKSSK